MLGSMIQQYHEWMNKKLLPTIVTDAQPSFLTKNEWF